MKTEIYDLNEYKLSNRNGGYGGNAGCKDGIIINDECWMLKYPKRRKGEAGELIYDTAPLSEYIGSHIYQILGMDSQETILGIKQDKLVVACKDFCPKSFTDLREVRTLKNVYCKEVSEGRKEILLPPYNAHLISMEELFLHMQYNPILAQVTDAKKRFWEQFVVDMFIGNNRRTDSDWGLLWEDDIYRLAPVYDNGGAFFYKASEDELSAVLSDDNMLQGYINSKEMIYCLKGQRIQPQDLLEIEDRIFYSVVLDLVPMMRDRMQDIKTFIENIPEEYEGIPICSQNRGLVYIKAMELWLEQWLIPVYEKVHLIILAEK